MTQYRALDVDGRAVLLIRLMENKLQHTWKLKELYDLYPICYPNDDSQATRKPAIRNVLLRHCLSSKEYLRDSDPQLLRPPLFENPARGHWRLRMDYAQHLPAGYHPCDDTDEHSDSDAAVDAPIGFDTVRQAMRQERVGQPIFRQSLIAIERSRCRFNAITDPHYLEACHIKQWYECKDEPEHRLDGNNGLLLTPSLHKLFDKALFTLGDNGNVIRSTHLDPSVAEGYGLAHDLVNVGTFNQRQQRYLAYHRERFAAVQDKLIRR